MLVLPENLEEDFLRFDHVSLTEKSATTKKSNIPTFSHTNTGMHTEKIKFFFLIISTQT